MLVANEAERSHLIEDKKHALITRGCKAISEKIKFPFALDSSGKENCFYNNLIVV
jgi:hypothetical protein